MKPRRRAMRWFLSLAVLVYFTGALIYSNSAHAQTGTEVRVAELERRVTAADAEHLGERMARMEAALDTTNKLLVSVLVGIAGIVLERISQIGKRQRREQEAE